MSAKRAQMAPAPRTPFPPDPRHKGLTSTESITLPPNGRSHHRKEPSKNPLMCTPSKAEWQWEMVFLVDPLR